MGGGWVGRIWVSDVTGGVELTHNPMMIPFSLSH